jgi:acetylornithine deacetylase/succinyl-diaminopimelate desuccinylase-like protein
MDLPISLAVIDAVQKTSTEKIIPMPTLGGSLPLSIITEALGQPTITVPIANYDNNQHTENENIRLQNLWDGIETFASFDDNERLATEHTEDTENKEAISQ